MGARTGIAWTDATWNPIRGCSRVSEGCRHCYAEQFARRIPAYRDVVRLVGSEWRWTGDVQLVAEALDLPLRWRTPRRVFVNSMSDLFHEKVDDVWLLRIFNVMWQAFDHTFQVLTKRPERMRHFMAETWPRSGWWANNWPPPNVWLGVSCEDDEALDARWPALRDTPAAVRFISAEPLLSCFEPPRSLALDWLILGCESGPGRRNQSAYEGAARTMIQQAQAAAVPVFHKQMPVNGRVSRDPAEWPEDLRVQEFPPRATAGSPRS